MLQMGVLLQQKIFNRKLNSMMKYYHAKFSMHYKIL